MSDFSLEVMMGLAAGTAVFHTLIPDHWLPFVLIGRARGWSIATTAAISGLSALVHVVFSAGLGFVTVWIGLQTAEAVGETLEHLAGVLLIVFGLGYALWAYRKGGHFHPGAGLLHAGAGHACAGAEGDENPEHLHYHADAELISGGRGVAPIGLALIIGLNPCVLLLPWMLRAAEFGGGAMAMVVVAYSIPTALLMIGLSSLGVAGVRNISLPGVARHMEWVSGLLVAVVGTVLLFTHQH
ncbi:MAG: hypothetical protein GY716_21975 [bacterium]|nr:hypothetical protein [bacterium]